MKPFMFRSRRGGKERRGRKKGKKEGRREKKKEVDAIGKRKKEEEGGEGNGDGE